MAFSSEDLVLPLMQAPMFIAASLDLVIASCQAGVIGAFTAANPRGGQSFEQWLEAIRDARNRAQDEGRIFAPYCVNLIASSLIDRERRLANLASCKAARVPLILTNLGDPTLEVEAAHDWGGLVFHDVTTIRHAEKAIAAGVDGLMLVCAGAGGHAGTLNPFSFLPQVRAMFDGIIMLAGGIADGSGIAAALALGADLVVMGTRFIATVESGTSRQHKQMLVDAGSEDILFTDAIAGMPASFLRPSIVAAGLRPDALPKPKAFHRPDLPDGVKAWKDIFSAGHSTGLVRDVPHVSELVRRLTDEFQRASVPFDWRYRLADRMLQARSR